MWFELHYALIINTTPINYIAKQVILLFVVINRTRIVQFERTLKRVKAVKDEVKELHPLLNELFRSLPTIKHVEYKQGNREAGADFVVVKQDPVWKQDEYVGVVVKSGKITQNSHDVTAQIDQCATMKRTINGKKEILVNEIWVVTSLGITQNAQDYFSQKYTNHKVKFIGPEELSNMVVDYLPEYFEGISIPINHYLQKTKESIERLQASTKLWFQGMNGLNINQELIFRDNRKYSKNNTKVIRHKNVNIDALINKGGVSLIEGSIGSGKSSLLRSTAIRYLDPIKFENERRLPVYVQFKDFGEEHNFSLESLIHLETNDFNGEDIKYIVMIDGIDETHHNIDERLEVLEKIIYEAESNDRIKLIMTSRISEKDTLLSRLKSHVRTYQIAPLSMKQVINIINTACSQLNTKNRIIEDLKKSNLFKALPKTPIAAILLAKLLNENNKEIPSNLTELYSKYTEIALGRWDIDKELTKEKEFDAAEAITKNLAKYFFDNDLLVISKIEAKQFFYGYLDKRKMGLNADELFDKIANRSEIFYVDETKNTFGFRHRTFIEFFYAKNAITTDDFKINPTCFEAQWLAVSFFWVGLQRDCPSAIRNFALTKPSDERGEILKLINMGNVLLAGYSTEYDVITQAIAQTFSDAGKYFKEITNTGSTSVFSNFSEMQLLSLFRHLLADSYGYDFFADAIEEAMLLIDDDGSLSVEERIYALFFLETSLTNPSGDDLFKHLIEKYSKKLPMCVALGITHESRNKDMKNKYISKVMRNVKKITETREMQQHINILYEKPIKHLSVK
ncbi:MAG TPA: hypothetical protein DG048_09885 [Pseudoalteromonas sp.]|nr:hypothetical protein [Pseudoalteromonas sp.]